MWKEIWNKIPTLKPTWFHAMKLHWDEEISKKRYIGIKEVKRGTVLCTTKSIMGDKK